MLLLPITLPDSNSNSNSKIMTMRILLSHPNSVAHHNSRHRDDLVVHHQHAAFPKRMSVVQEGVVSATTTTTASSSPSSPSSPLVSCRKESSESMTSWASISSTETTESDSGFSLGRRQIFSEYWKTNTPVVLDLQQQQQQEEEAEEQNHPRSPLIQHYPTRNYSESPTSTMQEQEPKQLLSVSPCRRSIFGSSKRSNNNNNSNNNISNMYNRQVDLDGFFSTHTHMKVLSSSTLDSTMSSDNTALVRRPRSFSCSDAPLRKGPLTSCLKRGNSNSDCHNTSTSTTTISTIGSSSTNNNDAATLPMLRRPSVTFDSQIEIIAFERINSYDGEPSCMDGSWTNQFDR